VEHVECMGTQKMHTILVDKPQGKTPLKTPTCRWEHNV